MGESEEGHVALSIAYHTEWSEGLVALLCYTEERTDRCTCSEVGLAGIGIITICNSVIVVLSSYIIESSCSNRI